MILSHAYRFIFLKTNKTAGTSIEIALSEFCEETDIITPITPEDEEVRRSLGFRGPQNYRIPLLRYQLRDWMRLFLRGQRTAFFNHMAAVDVKRLVGEQVWSSYYKFCFERNPWDRVISLYYWRCRNKDPMPSISEFINSGALEVLKKRGLELYTINREVAVDRVCLFEKLADELEQVRTRVGLPTNLSLPKVKGTYRKDKQHYRDLLSPEDEATIAKLFEREIALFGYEY
ncbi:MAG: sulfotransferase family 2 domain-containing protein [Fidelibacterota bacterium]|nr:MAG: sulfotransferase family 2 domain-containing protein [Candidatus Neomarinimicrobiota bacterium]